MPGITNSAKPLFLAVASIGNPGAKFAGTRHSVGHMFLQRMQKDFDLPRLNRSNQLTGGLVSIHRAQPFMLFESLNFMNISGDACFRLWKWLCLTKKEHYDPKLLILHDELELPVGEIKYRPESLKVNGHNGLRNIKERLKNPTARIAIGIGRPIERDSKAVSDYVLSPFTNRQREILLQTAYPQVLELIMDIRERGQL